LGCWGGSWFFGGGFCHDLILFFNAKGQRRKELLYYE
jgi:hypothetical protein